MYLPHTKRPPSPTSELRSILTDPDAAYPSAINANSANYRGCEYIKSVTDSHSQRTSRQYTRRPTTQYEHQPENFPPIQKRYVPAPPPTYNAWTQRPQQQPQQTQDTPTQRQPRQSTNNNRQDPMTLLNEFNFAQILSTTRQYLPHLQPAPTADARLQIMVQICIEILSNP